MARGVPLTPEQVAKASEVYERTGNYSAAARAIKADVSATRKALLRTAKPDRAKLQARARDRGIRQARRYVQRGQALAAKLLACEGTDGPGMEPRDVAAILNVIARCAETLCTVDERYDRRRQSRLTRDRTRAETAAAKREAEGKGGTEPAVIAPDDPRWRDLQRQHLGSERQGVTGGPRRDGDPD